MTTYQIQATETFRVTTTNSVEAPDERTALLSYQQQIIEDRKRNPLDVSDPGVQYSPVVSVTGTASPPADFVFDSFPTKYVASETHTQGSVTITEGDLGEFVQFLLASIVVKHVPSGQNFQYALDTFFSLWSAVTAVEAVCSLPSGSVDNPYSAQVSSVGGRPPITWSVSPPLPSGLSLNTSTGEITGTPTEEWNQTHLFLAMDANNVTARINYALVVTG